jgi:hypothetical protein
MFLPNDVIHYPAPRRLVRILWIDRERGIAWTYELGMAHALPQACPLRRLAEDVLGRHARLLPDDPCAPAPPSVPQPASHLALQEKAWRIVAHLHAGLPALYEPRARARMIADCALRFGVSRASVLRYLRRYWERGQTVDALLPDYANSGAAGKTRGASAGVKRGRPRKAGAPAGLNVDAAIRATFGAAVARYCALHPVFSRRACYARMLDDFYPGRDAGAVPSFGQFSYWLDKDAKLPPTPANRNGAAQYADA